MGTSYTAAEADTYSTEKLAESAITITRKNYTQRNEIAAEARREREEPIYVAIKQAAVGSSDRL